MISQREQMSKMRTLYNHVVYSLSPGELTLDQYRELTKPQRKNYKKKAKEKGWKPIWEALYTQSDILSQIKNKHYEQTEENDFFEYPTYD